MIWIRFHRKYCQNEWQDYHFYFIFCLETAVIWVTRFSIFVFENLLLISKWKSDLAVFSSKGGTVRRQLILAVTHNSFCSIGYY